MESLNEVRRKGGTVRNQQQQQQQKQQEACLPHSFRKWPTMSTAVLPFLCSKLTLPRMSLPRLPLMPQSRLLFSCPPPTLTSIDDQPTLLPQPLCRAGWLRGVSAKVIDNV